MEVKAKIDVREVAPANRHSLIFTTFDTLIPGEALEILVDHEPRPLQAQFNDLRADVFKWHTIEAGPAQWRIQIERIKAATCCGCGC